MLEDRERSEKDRRVYPLHSLRLTLFSIHIVSLFLSNPCTPSTLSLEAFVYFVCPTKIPQPPFAWKYYMRTENNTLP